MQVKPRDAGARSANEGLAAFLDGISPPGRRPGAVAVFHAVRNLPYHSDGDRSLAGILHRRSGSCSSKHILLAALLNEIGCKASVELVRGDFATPLLAARNIPATLAGAALAGIRDIHNIVRAEIDGEPVILDATWHDAMEPFALRVNGAWNGQGDTEIAVDVEEMLGASAHPAEDKARIIASWPEMEQRKRRRFLDDVNSWVASVATETRIRER